MSALVLPEAGLEALGTSSAAIAATLGRIDGPHAISRELHLDHAALLGGLTELPINVISRTATARPVRTLG